MVQALETVEIYPREEPLAQEDLTAKFEEAKAQMDQSTEDAIEKLSQLLKHLRSSEDGLEMLKEVILLLHKANDMLYQDPNLNEEQKFDKLKSRMLYSSKYILLADEEDEERSEMIEAGE